MGKLIQYRTEASLYDGPFDSTVGWSAAGMGYIIVGEGRKLIVVDGGFDNDAEALLSLLEAQTEGNSPRSSFGSLPIRISITMAHSVG